jgi:uncharacterized protein YjlB
MNEPQTFTFTDDGAIPNSKLPMLVYRAAVPADPAAIEKLFAANRWPPAWRNSVHPFQHFHSNAHEALGVARGRATVQFGGPAGETLEVQAGDVVVLPAGVGHCRMDKSASRQSCRTRRGGAQHCRGGGPECRSRGWRAGAAGAAVGGVTATPLRAPEGRCWCGGRQPPTSPVPSARRRGGSRRSPPRSADRR